MFSCTQVPPRPKDLSLGSASWRLPPWDQHPSRRCCWLTWGAEVLRVDRLSDRQAVADMTAPSPDVLNRGKHSVAVDLKHPVGVETVLRLVAGADVLIEGFRPGVAERLGIGPDICRSRNPRLVYGRMTGWGQDGPHAGYAGHDINHIVLAGVLAHMGRPGEPPAPPLSLVGDFGGGGLLLAFGILCALMERARSGEGQAVDSAMVHGPALLSTQLYGMRAAGMWQSKCGGNLVDGGAQFYDTYETAEGKYIALGSIEPQFYTWLTEALGLPPGDQFDKASWPHAKPRSLPSSRRKHVTSGARRWKLETCASRQCSTWTRPIATLTTPTVRHSSSMLTCCSRRPHHACHAHPAPSLRPRLSPAETQSKPSPPGDSGQRTSTG